MPKIKKLSFYDSKAEASAESSLEYSEGQFFIRIAKDCTSLAEGKDCPVKTESKHLRGMGYNEKAFLISRATEEKAVRDWTKYMKAFHTLKISTEKVILIYLDFESFTREAGQDGGKKEEKENDTYYGRDTKELEIKFDYQVVDKKTTGSHSHYIRKDGIKVSEGVNDKIGQHYQEKWVEIPHTKENEAFVKSIYSGFESIMDKLYLFMGTRDTILKTIESKQKLLT